MRWLGELGGVMCKPDRKNTQVPGEPDLGLTQRCFAYGLSISKAETQWGWRWEGKIKVEVSVI